jgi:hypothetical protein
MVSTRGKFVLPLTFSVGDLQSLGIHRGNNGFDTRNRSWMTFSITVPSRFSSDQSIWLLSDEAEDNKADAKPGYISSKRKRHRQLTAAARGTFHLRSQIEPGPDGDPDTLAWNNEFPGTEFYHEECYILNLSLPEREFNDIRTLLASGKPPSTVTVYTSDVSFGSSPNGNDREWDIEENRFLAILGYSIEMSVATQRVMVDAKRTDLENEAAAETDEAFRKAVLDAREDIQLLSFRQAHLNKLVNWTR